MLEVGQIFGLCSAVLLIGAVAAWANLRRRPALQRIGGRPKPNSAPAEHASQLLLVALGLSAVAAVLAVAGWIAP